MLETPAPMLDPATRQRVLPDGCMDVILGLAGVAAGAAPVQTPHEQPWGQVLSYLRDPDGHLVEICSPVR